MYFQEGYKLLVYIVLDVDDPEEISPLPARVAGITL